MVGLEKVTNKILSAAEADAASVLSAADEECHGILAAAEERAAEIRREAEDAAEAEGTGVVSRARATASTERRNILLAGRCRAVDAAFEAAEKKICGMPRENYLAFLLALARGAAEGQKGGEAVITLNRADRENVGAELLERLSEGSDGIVWKIAENDARIDGGFLLDIGLTRVDCSVMALINQVRPSLEADVCRILFDSSRKDKENG